MDFGIPFHFFFCLAQNWNQLMRIVRHFHFGPLASGDNYRFLMVTSSSSNLYLF
uniref:Uncharacterized protein n=1 Tax=Manihot esculenta TaxID=3983 RepID=A0A2C9U1U6_MANES